MKITLDDLGTRTRLIWTSVSTSSELVVPISAPALRNLLTTLLLDPDSSFVEHDGVIIDRVADGVRVHAHGGRFDMPYRALIPIVLDEIPT